MEDESAIASLESRIYKLENLVYGKSGERTPFDSSSSLLELLLNANHLISAAANQNKNIAEVFKRLDELDEILTEDIIGLPAAEQERKRNLVLSLADQYQKNISVIEKVYQLHSALDKGNLKSFDELKPQLSEILNEHAVLKSRLEEANTAEQLPTARKALFQEVTMELVAAHNRLSQLEVAKEERRED